MFYIPSILSLQPSVLGAILLFDGAAGFLPSGPRRRRFRVDRLRSGGCEIDPMPLITPRAACRNAAEHLTSLSGCEEGNVRLPPAETVTCARDRLKGHVGTVSQTGDAIIYSYDSANGPAKVIVIFDAKRRHVSTFFESTPYGTHEELMEATEAIKNCAEYGRAPNVRRAARYTTLAYS